MIRCLKCAVKAFYKPKTGFFSLSFKEKNMLKCARYSFYEFFSFFHLVV